MKLIKSLLGASLTAIVLLCAIWGAYRIFPLRYLDEIRRFSDEMDVDRYLVAALIKAESNFDSMAVSSARAKGVMQLTDETAAFCADKLGIKLSEGDIFSPGINIRLGVFYIRKMLDDFSGNEKLAIAAYNAGGGRVREWLKNPDLSSDGKTLHTVPYKETDQHIKKIHSYKKIYKLLYPNL